MVSIQVIKLVIDNSSIEEYEKVYFAEHPKAKKKPIAHPYHESINKWMIMKRPQMNALKQKWKDFIIYFIQHSEHKDVHIEQCELKFTTYYGTERRHDIDNGCPKFILDGLCDSGFIIDDDSKHITSLTMQCFVDADNPRTEIEVYVSKLLTDYKQPELKEDKPMAKKKVQKISVNAMDIIMKQYETVKTVEWNGLQVVIKKDLSLEEMMTFANSVVKSCFDQASGAYMPEIKDFAIRANVLDMYTNFTLPKDLGKQYDMVVQSGAVEMVLNHINHMQFNELVKAIDSKLQNTADANIQAYITKMDNVTTAFSDMQTKMENLFSGVDNEDISKLVGAIANGDNTEEGIVKSYLKLVTKDE